MVVLLLDRSNGIKLISNWYKLNTDRSSLGNPGKTRRGEGALSGITMEIEWEILLEL